ncbi:nucleotide exchange factor GrpE [bacterium E08(2017)]|nr:nucleotide exchange factor GrpE [bacterium E08(2017)]
MDSEKDKTEEQAEENTVDIPSEEAQAEKPPKKSKKKKSDKKKEEPLADQLLRLRADFDNFRKRTMRERSEIYQRANEDLMEELIPVLDHLDLALKAAGEHGTDDSFVDGIKLVGEQFITALGKHGLEPIDAESGTFDHNIHEAISHIPSDEVAEDGIVAQVRRGYMLGGKLLRAAQVVVSSGPGPSGGE